MANCETARLTGPNPVTCCAQPAEACVVEL
jgi:hypothetical protein